MSATPSRPMQTKSSRDARGCGSRKACTGKALERPGKADIHGPYSRRRRPLGGLYRLTRTDRPEPVSDASAEHGFDEATPGSFIVVDDDLIVIEGAGSQSGDLAFICGSTSAQPNIRSIVHHSIHLGAVHDRQLLIVAHMDMLMFQDQCAYLPDWPGLPIGDEEGIVIPPRSAPRKTILLANHGLITTGETIEVRRHIWRSSLNERLHCSLTAAAAGTIHPVDPDARHARPAHSLLKPKIVEMTFEYLARRALRQNGAQSSAGAVETFT